MQYMLIIYVPPREAEITGDMDAGVRAVWDAYTKDLIDAGAMRGGEELHPPATATTVRSRNGERLLHDGPYADTKEQLGGFYLIEAPDLDAALAWAHRCPAAQYGAVEVRPVVQMQ